MPRIRPVTALRRCSGTGSLRVSRTASIAALYARPTEFDFGAVARYSVASVSGNIASGMPMKCAACWAATATLSACGSASPTSSPARMTSRRAMNIRSSPDSSMRASQYTAASGSEPRTDLMNAEMVS